jgi:hypothetical protein
VRRQRPAASAWGGWPVRSCGSNNARATRRSVIRIGPSDGKPAHSERKQLVCEILQESAASPALAAHVRSVPERDGVVSAAKEREPPQSRHDGGWVGTGAVDPEQTEAGRRNHSSRGGGSGSSQRKKGRAANLGAPGQHSCLSFRCARPCKAAE